MKLWRNMNRAGWASVPAAFVLCRLGGIDWCGLPFGLLLGYLAGWAAWGLIEAVLETPASQGEE